MKTCKLIIINEISKCFVVIRKKINKGAVLYPILSSIEYSGLKPIYSVIFIIPSLKAGVISARHIIGLQPKKKTPEGNKAPGVFPTKFSTMTSKKCLI